MVLRQGLGLALVGIAVGVVLSLGATHLLAAGIEGVQGMEPLAFLGLPLTLVLVVLVATLLPARRAALLDPVKALRCE